MSCFVFRFILSLCEVAIVAIYSDHDWWPIWYFLNHVFPFFSSCFLIFSSSFPLNFLPRYLQRPQLVANMVFSQSCSPPLFLLFSHVFLLFSCNFFSTLSRATTIGITIWYIFLFSIWYVFLFFQSGIFFFSFSSLVYFSFFRLQSGISIFYFLFMFSCFPPQISLPDLILDKIRLHLC